VSQLHELGGGGRRADHDDGLGGRGGREQLGHRSFDVGGVAVVASVRNGALVGQPTGLERRQTAGVAGIAIRVALGEEAELARLDARKLGEARDHRGGLVGIAGPVVDDALVGW
jgi:hypothetical protein